MFHLQEKTFLHFNCDGIQSLAFLIFFFVKHEQYIYVSALSWQARNPILYINERSNISVTQSICSTDDA